MAIDGRGGGDGHFVRGGFGERDLFNDFSTAIEEDSIGVKEAAGGGGSLEDDADFPAVRRVGDNEAADWVATVAIGEITV